MASDLANLGPKVQAMGGVQFSPTGIRLMDGTGAPTDGTSGTGAGKAAPGSLYLRTDSPNLYVNTGTQASPTWEIVARDGGSPSLAAIHVDNGSSSAPSLGFNASVFDGFYRLSTGVVVYTSNGSPTLVLAASHVMRSNGEIRWGPTINPVTHQVANDTDTGIGRSGVGVLKATTGDGGAYGAVESLYQRFGSGSPEGVVTAPVGAVYHRTNGGANTSFYVKESGAGNTGWVAK